MELVLAPKGLLAPLALRWIVWARKGANEAFAVIKRSFWPIIEQL